LGGPTRSSKNKKGCKQKKKSGGPTKNSIPGKGNPWGLRHTKERQTQKRKGKDIPSQETGLRQPRTSSKKEHQKKDKGGKRTTKKTKGETQE